MANGKAFNYHPSIPRILEPLNSAWSENQVDIERTILELYKIFAALDFVHLFPVKIKSEIQQCSGQSAAILLTAVNE